MVQNMKPDSEEPDLEEVLPTWDVTPPEPAEEALPVAEPISEEDVSSNVPLAEPVSQAGKPDLQLSESALHPQEPGSEAEALSLPKDADRSTPVHCPVCGAARRGEESSCGDCGYYFSPVDLEPRHAVRSGAGNSSATSSDLPAFRLKDRYEVRERISERCGVSRFRGLDHGSGTPIPVILVRQAVMRPAEAVPAEEAPTAEPAVSTEKDEELLPNFDEPSSSSLPPTEVLPALPVWPSLEWEQALLSTGKHPGLPALLDRFPEGDFEYLVEEVPVGQTLWDAWDDPEADSARRFGYLANIAEILHQLHPSGVILEGLRPEIIVISPDGRVRLSDMGELLQLPLPADLPLRRSLYTAPEVLA